MQADRDVVLAAVDQDGNALQYADDDLRADSEIALLALHQRPEAMHARWDGVHE
jgi:hypothetical protein